MEISCEFSKGSYLKDITAKKSLYQIFEIHSKKQKINNNIIHTGIILYLPQNVSCFIYNKNKQLIENIIECNKEIIIPTTKKRIYSFETIGYIQFHYHEDIPINNVTIKKQ